MENTVTIKLNNDISYLVDIRFARMSRVLNENNFDEEIPFECDEKTFQTILNFYKFYDYDPKKLDNLPTHYHSDNLEMNIGADNLILFKDYLIYEEKGNHLYFGSKFMHLGDKLAELKPQGDLNKLNTEDHFIKTSNKESSTYKKGEETIGPIKDITSDSQVKVDFLALRPLVNICQQHDFLYIKDLLVIMMGTEFYCENSEEGLESLKRKFGVGRLDEDEIVGIIEENKGIFDELNEKFIEYLEKHE